MRESTAVRVAVCIPTRNRAGYVPQAIESVLRQTYQDFLIIVSDNASTDGTAEVVAGYEDPRISYFRHESDVGWCDNFNSCLDRVPPETEYCVLLCDDDVFFPEYLERIVPVADANERVGLAHTRAAIIGPTGDVIWSRAGWMQGAEIDPLERGEEFIRRSMLWSTRVCGSSGLMRRRALEQLRYDRAEAPAADLGVWLRIALAWDVAFVDEPLVAFRVHHDSLSSSWTSQLDGVYGPSTFEYPQLVRRVKERFIAEFGSRVGESDELRRLADRSERLELVNVVRTLTKPERRIRRTMRLLSEAVRLRRRVAFEPAAWQLVAASVLGPRIVSRFRAELPGARP